MSLVIVFPSDNVVFVDGVALAVSRFSESIHFDQEIAELMATCCTLLVTTFCILRVSNEGGGGSR
jgi:hypothetical protein